MSAQATADTNATTGRTRSRGALLSAATLSQFGASVMQQGTIVLGVFIAAAYHLSLTQMGAVLATMTFGLMFSGLVNGPLVDLWGPRRLLFFGTIVISAAALAIAASPGLGVTVALLFVAGLALGTVPLAGTKAVLLTWPRERRGMPMGFRQMGVPLGALAASLTLPTIANSVGIHPIYLGFAVVVALCGLLFCAMLPSQTTRPSRHEARRAPGEARRILVPAIVGFLLAWGQYTLITYTIPMLRSEGVTLIVAGVLLAIAQVGGAAARLVLGHLSDRMGGQRARVMLGVTLIGVALAVILAVLPPHMPIALLAPLWFALGTAFVGWNALALTWAGERVTAAHAGSAMGMETSAVLCGATVSAPLFGAIVERSGSYQAAWLTLAMVLAVAAALLWTQTRRPEAHQADAPTTRLSADSQTI
ncbi:MAG TPA: MFS transporter [Ktedonobacterales bacterium]|jgi:MFS family permease|nr:MFS transporter [Ktedonobacterales bacterium]